MRATAETRRAGMLRGMVGILLRAGKLGEGLEKVSAGRAARGIARGMQGTSHPGQGGCLPRNGSRMSVDGVHGDFDFNVAGAAGDVEGTEGDGLGWGEEGGAFQNGLADDGAL